MVLQLDPRFPLVWRSPTSLQFGVATPVVRLDDVTTADEYMLAALATGVSGPGLTMIGTSAGASALDVASLLTRVTPALRGDPRPQRRVLVEGAGHTASRVVDAVRATGAEVVSAQPQLVVIVADYVVPPELHGAWLRRDIPHLPVVVTDSTVEIGPVVEPGIGPCLYCLLKSRTELDPAWPAIAAQLSGSRSRANNAVVAGEVAALVARVVDARFDNGVGDRHVRLELDIATGQIRSTELLARHDCGCQAIRGPTRSGSAGAGPGARPPLHPIRPTTRRASSARG
jgi:bacteriocin biosynthesis cyclodehydratase domain-containing protein